MIKSGATVDLFIANDVRPHFNMQADCTVHRIPVSFRHVFLNIVVFQIYLCLLLLVHLFQTGKPDLIYARQNFSGFPVLILTRLWKIAYFAETNGIIVRAKENSNSFKQRVKSGLEGFCFKLADVVIVPSETLKQRILSRYGLPAEKISCVPNGGNEILFCPGDKRSSLLEDLGLKDRDFVVGFVGSMGKWQGIEVLKDAIQRTVSQDDDIKFLLVGDFIKDSNIAKLKAGFGDASENIIDYIKKKSLIDKTIYHPFVSYEDSSDFMNLCDVLVAPYTNDYVEFGGGSPMKLYAYLACAKPVIISDLGEFTDSLALKKHKAAYLIPPGDFNALTEAILFLKQNKKMREQFSINGRSFVLEERKWSDSCSKILTIFNQNVPFN
jgi:glycosyltransferase involved in cell wall biosynthesis